MICLPTREALLSRAIALNFVFEVVDCLQIDLGL